MIKALFFDLGKVLVQFDWTPAIEKLARASALDASAIRELVTTSPLALRFEKGDITSDNFFEQLREKLGCHIAIQDLRDVWSDIFTPIDDNIALVRSLKGRFFLGLISNTNPVHVDWIRRRFQVFESFDRLTFSYEARAMKPEAAIFDRARGDFSPPEVWFVDDMQANAEGARRLGWQAAVLPPGTPLRNILPSEIL